MMRGSTNIKTKNMHRLSLSKQSLTFTVDRN